MRSLSTPRPDHAPQTGAWIFVGLFLDLIPTIIRGVIDIKSVAAERSDGLRRAGLGRRRPALRRPSVASPSRIDARSALV
jgi:hypothetical protein